MTDAPLTPEQEMEQRIEQKLIRKFRRRTTAQLTAFTGLAVAAFLGFNSVQDVTAENQKATTALCAVRADYARRVKDADAALDLTPAQRFEKYGIRLSDETLEASRENARRSLTAIEFAKLTCPPEPVPKL